MVEETEESGVWRADKSVPDNGRTPPPPPYGDESAMPAEVLPDAGHWLQRVATAREVAHDLRSLIAGVGFAVGTIADQVARGEMPSADLVEPARRASVFVVELFDALSKGTADVHGPYDLWAVALLTAVGHPGVDVQRDHSPLPVHGARLDGARLVSLLIDNAIEHGTKVQVLEREGSLVVSNSLPQETEDRVRRVRRPRHGRGTGLVHARLLADHLGLALSIHDDGRRFEAVLSPRGRSG